MYKIAGFKLEFLQIKNKKFEEEEKKNKKENNKLINPK